MPLSLKLFSLKTLEITCRFICFRVKRRFQPIDLGLGGTSCPVRDIKTAISDTMPHFLLQGCPKAWNKTTHDVVSILSLHESRCFISKNKPHFQICTLILMQHQYHCPVGRYNTGAFLENLGAAINNGLWSAGERASRCLSANSDQKGTK